MKLPAAELKIEDASFPFAAWVNTTTIDIVMGIQEHTTIPSAKSFPIILPDCNARLTP